MKTESLFPPLDRRRIITLTELKVLTGFSDDSLRRYAERGEIVGLRAGKGRKWRFKREDVERWWASLHQPQVADRR